MNLPDKEPNHNDWLGMEGLLLGHKLQAEVEILKELKIFGFLDLKEHPTVSGENINNINKLLSEMHYHWRVMSENGLIFFIHTSEIRSSTTV